MKPVLYRIISKDLTASESLHKRNLSWFDNNLIVCCLYSNKNWMGRFLTKHLEEIKLEAKLKGFRFFWTEDPNMEEFMDLSIVNKPGSIIQDEIEHYLFAHQGATHKVITAHCLRHTYATHLLDHRRIGKKR